MLSDMGSGLAGDFMATRRDTKLGSLGVLSAGSFDLTSLWSSSSDQCPAISLSLNIIDSDSSLPDSSEDSDRCDIGDFRLDRGEDSVLPNCVLSVGAGE